MKIFDCFLFGGELDLLEHRLRETYALVDRFILVEAAETFRGDPKPLHYRDNAERFSWAADKVRPIALRSLGARDSSPWDREALQRNAIMLGLGAAAPEDIVLILDADEIVSASALAQLRREGLTRPHRLAMTRHYEFADMLAPASACCADPDAAFPFERGIIRPGPWSALSGDWHETTGIAVRGKDLLGDAGAVLPSRSAYEMRRAMHAAPVIACAGRHLVSVDPGIRGGRKLSQVSHDELADSRALVPEHLARAQRHGVHHHGWWFAERPAGDLPGDLQRLADRSPGTMRGAPVRHGIARRLARTWSWLRFWPMLPAGLVQAVDRHFAMLAPVIAVPLMIADALRAIGARAGWRWLAAFSSGSKRHGHG